jgi:hypothetical protein
MMSFFSAQCHNGALLIERRERRKEMSKGAFFTKWDMPSFCAAWDFIGYYYLFIIN